MRIEKSHRQNPRPHNCERSEPIVEFSGRPERVQKNQERRRSPSKKGRI